MTIFKKKNVLNSNVSSSVFANLASVPGIVTVGNIFNSDGSVPCVFEFDKVKTILNFTKGNFREFKQCRVDRINNPKSFNKYGVNNPSLNYHVDTKNICSMDGNHTIHAAIERAMETGEKVMTGNFWYGLTYSQMAEVFIFKNVYRNKVGGWDLLNAYLAAEYTKYQHIQSRIDDSLLVRPKANNNKGDLKSLSSLELAYENENDESDNILCAYLNIHEIFRKSSPEDISIVTEYVEKAMVKFVKKYYNKHGIQHLYKAISSVSTGTITDMVKSLGKARNNDSAYFDVFEKLLNDYNMGKTKIKTKTKKIA